MASPLLAGACILGIVITIMAWFLDFHTESVTTICLGVILAMAVFGRKPPPPKYGKRLPGLDQRVR